MRARAVWIVVVWFCVGAPAFAQEEPAGSPPEVRQAPIAESTSELCRDGADNDADGHVDCADQDCGDFVFCRERQSSRSEASQLSTAQPSAVLPPMLPGQTPGRLARGTGIAMVVLGASWTALAAGLSALWATCGGELAGGGAGGGGNLYPASYLDDVQCERSGVFGASMGLFALGGVQLVLGLVLTPIGASRMRRHREAQQQHGELPRTRSVALSLFLSPTIDGGTMLGLSGTY